MKLGILMFTVCCCLSLPSQNWGSFKHGNSTGELLIHVQAMAPVEVASMLISPLHLCERESDIMCCEMPCMHFLCAADNCLYTHIVGWCSILVIFCAIFDDPIWLTCFRGLKPWTGTDCISYAPKHRWFTQRLYKKRTIIYMKFRIQLLK